MNDGDYMYDQYDDDFEQDEDDEVECGLMPDGQCMLAGTEHCDWDCGALNEVRIEAMKSTDSTKEGQAMADLKPCPFCGDPMDGTITDDERGFSRGSYGSLMVSCDNRNCGALGPSSQTMKGAVDAWNVRSTKEGE